jgi:hypothetical protein
MAEIKSPGKINKSWIFLLFFLVSLVDLYPILSKFFTALPYPLNGDVNLTIGILYSYVNKVAALDFRGIYHLPIIFPYSYGFTMGSNMIGQALLLLPFHLLGLHNIYLIYNIFTFLCYILTGYCAYLFFRELTGSQKAALVAASLYILVPFRIFNVPHLNMMFNFTIPLCFFYLFRYLKESRRPDLILFNIFLLLQFLFDISHGFYLAVALGLFYLIFMLANRKATRQNTLVLILSLIPTILLVLFLHYPYFIGGLSLSTGTGSFNPNQYNSSSSFYSGYSYFFKLFIHRRYYYPYYPGFLVSLFFMLAFHPYLRRRREKILYGAALLSLILPALLLTFYAASWKMKAMETITDVYLGLFVLALAVMVGLIKDRLDTGLKVAAWTYLALVVISFWPFPRFFSFFGLLTRLFPLLSRSRGTIRTMYIVPLLMLAVFAFGLRYFVTSRKRSSLVVILILLLLFGEQLRNKPVITGRIVEPGRHSLALYQNISRLPIESGVLELPFLNPILNIYPLFTRFHNKHTYHGHHYFYNDALLLQNRPELDHTRGFPGLKDERFIQYLCQNRLRLILINRNFIPERDVWWAIKQNIRVGQGLGLYERVDKNNGAILLIIRDRMAGSDISVSLPYYFFLGKRQLQFQLEIPQGSAYQVSFNGKMLAAESRNEGGQWLLELSGPWLNPQLNILQVKADRPVVLTNVHLQ